MNQPQFIISGKLRRQAKKQLAELKRFVKMFWYIEDIDRVYGGGMEDVKCEKLLTQKQKQIHILEQQLERRL